MARSTVYYKNSRKQITFFKALDEVLVEKIRSIIEANPTFGVRRIIALIKRQMQKAVNRKKIHRIIKANGWQVRKKGHGFKKRAQGMSAKAKSSKEKWMISINSYNRLS